MILEEYALQSKELEENVSKSVFSKVTKPIKLLSLDQFSSNITILQQSICKEYKCHRTF